jgi:hypothetical protein
MQYVYSSQIQTARMPDQPGFTDRQEMNRSIATVLVASSGLCASTAGPILKIRFDIELGIPDSNAVPDDIPGSSSKIGIYLEFFFVSAKRYSGSTASTNRYFGGLSPDPGADSALAG